MVAFSSRFCDSLQNRQFCRTWDDGRKRFDVRCHQIPALTPTDFHIPSSFETAEVTARILNAFIDPDEASFSFPQTFLLRARANRGDLGAILFAAFRFLELYRCLGQLGISFFTRSEGFFRYFSVM